MDIVNEIDRFVLVLKRIYGAKIVNISIKENVNGCLFIDDNSEYDISLEYDDDGRVVSC